MSLPKPSPLSFNGNPQQQIQYIVSYLSRLVEQLDNTINRNGGKGETAARTVSDIGYNGTTGQITIRYTDGSVKYLDIGE